MRTFTIVRVREANGIYCVTYRDGGDPAIDPDSFQETQMPTWKISAFMAEYGIDDPTDALDQILHGVHAHQYVETLDPRDDPAVVGGWVTDSSPDAEPVHLYNARSTTDAAGAHRARVEATKAEHSVITDPDGLLTLIHEAPLDTALIAGHRQAVDVTRWELVYGGLPADPLTQTRMRLYPTLRG